MEEFSEKLKLLNSDNREAFNSWFYNASDIELQKSIFHMNSPEIISSYSRLHLKEYIKFARMLLQGQLPVAPDTVSLISPTNHCPYKYSQSCYILRDLLLRVLQFKYQIFFRTCTFLSIFEQTVYTDSRGFKFTTKPTPKKKFTKPLAVFTRILSWKLSQIFTQSFKSLKSFTSASDWKKRFKTRAQLYRNKLYCIQQMIVKGKVNLEQRALWKWKIISEVNENLSLATKLKEDSTLIKYLGNNANLRYFHCLKRKFEVWKESVHMSVTANTSVYVEFKPKSIQKCFEQKLIQGFDPLVNLANSIYSDTLESIQQFGNQKIIFASMVRSHCRNLNHIVQKSLTSALDKLKNNRIQAEYVYEYQDYEETVTVVKKEVNEYKVKYKPVVMLEFDEKNSLKVRLIIRYLKTLTKKLMKQKFKIWKKMMQSVIVMNFSNDTLDLGSFKISGEDCEKLKVVVNFILSIMNKKKNMNRLVLSSWMQESNRRMLFLAKIKNFTQEMRRKRSSCDFAFDVLKKNINYQEEC